MASIEVAIHGSVVALRIAGRANCTGSCDFKTLVDQLSSRGYSQFVVDLSACVLMDSTFLGVLVGFVLNVPQTKERRHFELLNPTPRVRELIEGLGVDDLFEMKEAAPIEMKSAVPVATEPLVPNPGAHSKTELCRTSLEAHEALMRYNEENRARFKDVARFLAEDLHRLEATGQ